MGLAYIQTWMTKGTACLMSRKRTFIGPSHRPTAESEKHRRQQEHRQEEDLAVGNKPYPRQADQSEQRTNIRSRPAAP